MLDVMSKVRGQPKPLWAPLPRPGCVNVEFRVLLGSEGIFVANLRFAEGATIDKHSASHEIDVICISGSGFTSIGEETFPIASGQTIRWPGNLDHCLWTDQTTMETIMIERHDV